MTLMLSMRKSSTEQGCKYVRTFLAYFLLIFLLIFSLPNFGLVLPWYIVIFGLISPFVLGLFIIVKFLLRDFRQSKRASTQRNLEFKENINSGSIHEAKILRDLTNDEKQSLKKRSNSIGSISKIYSFWSFVAFIMLFLSFLLIGLLNNLSSTSYYFIFILIVPVIVFTLFRQIFLKGEGPIYQDLRSPVFEVRGRLIKKILEENKQFKETHMAFIIRGVEFDSFENPQIRANWEKWIEGEEVRVEYSPFTKHIWKTEKA